MGGDLESGGAFVTAALAAGELEGEAGKPGPQVHAPCANCGVPLVGAYCHACGQRGHLHRSLVHLAEELLHGLLHFDAKGWRTLPLLAARPGLLTRRYIDGQRTRHVSPLAMFLFTVFLMFFVFSLVGPTPTTQVTDDAGPAEARSELQEAITEAQATLDEDQAELATARRDNDPAAPAERSLAKSRLRLDEARAALAAFDAEASRKAALPAPAASAASAATTRVVTEAQHLPRLNVKSDSPALDAAIRKYRKNPELALYKLKNTAYKFSFMLIPISLPFLWLMFLGRRDIAMYDHAVFSLYSLSFMSLLFVAAALLAMTPLSAALIWLLVLLVPPVHMFLQLRETYALETFPALWRTAALLAVAVTVFMLFVLFILAVGMR